MANKVSNKKRPKNIRKTLHTFSKYMGRHSLLMILVAFLVAVSALANLIGTYMIKPVINKYVAKGDMEGLSFGILITAIIFLTGALAALGYTQTMVKTAQKIVFDIRRDLFSKIQGLPIKYFDTHNSGDTMSLFTNDIDTVSEALNNSFAVVIQSFIQIVGTLVILFVLNWRLSIITLLGYAVMFIYIAYSGRKSSRYFGKQQKYLGELDGYVEEMISGQKVIKVFNHEEANMEGFRKKNTMLRLAGIKAQTYASTNIPMVVTISYVNYAITAVIGGILAIRGLMDVGGLASYLVFVRQAAHPINQFTIQLNLLLAAMAGAERIFGAMEELPETDEGTIEVDSLKGDVRFEHVSFGYNKDHLILKDISLYAKPGQKVAFVGSTGAGKTTITNLINRFYDISSGTITCDGINVKEIKKASLRRSLGIVLQDTHLFTGTISDNIRFGKTDASNEEVIAAAKLANAHSFIKRLPDGYNTMLTHDGANLSQGQRQLIAIARAAVANPPVLILDEATSSIDTRTEALIEKGMDRLMEGRTVFVIAHRLSTVRNANVIIVLEHGTIVERGTHEDLLSQKGKYYQLYHGMAELT